MRHYEDLPVGATSEYRTTYLVTEDEILEVGRRWDPQPFHTDPVGDERFITECRLVLRDYLDRFYSPQALHLLAALS